MLCYLQINAFETTKRCQILRALCVGSKRTKCEYKHLKTGKVRKFESARNHVH